MRNLALLILLIGLTLLLNGCLRFTTVNTTTSVQETSEVTPTPATAADNLSVAATSTPIPPLPPTPIAPVPTPAAPLPPPTPPLPIEPTPTAANVSTSAEASFPLAEDAYGVEIVEIRDEKFITFFTNQAFDDIVNLYQTQMADTDWQLTGDLIVKDNDENTAQLDFQREGERVNVTISPSDNGNSFEVVIMTGIKTQYKVIIGGN